MSTYSRFFTAISGLLVFACIAIPSASAGTINYQFTGMSIWGSPSVPPPSGSNSDSINVIFTLNAALTGNLSGINEAGLVDSWFLSDGPLSFNSADGSGFLDEAVFNINPNGALAGYTLDFSWLTSGGSAYHLNLYTRGTPVIVTGPSVESTANFVPFTLEISTGRGSFTLQAVPEPSTAVLGFAGIIGLLYMMRKNGTARATRSPR